MVEDKEVAILAAGCFWCVEAAFGRLKGVVEVVSGYCGGHVADPSYEEVCAGTTGHAEAVRIAFYPALIAYADLLEVFWHIHDPTTRNRQGADVGSQYRSAIFYLDEGQRQAALTSREAAEASRLWPAPIVTEIVAAGPFYPAEPYHQQYFRFNRNQPYCRMVIEPKLQKLIKDFPAFLDEHQPR